ncbi:hypothetical protein [Nocardioides alcanivorans]|uniref:hypothetical protein n=1 Tax=Nocardioides alcanivorans TaxID=2897352 RepID=UPI001F46437A|nr:hypothetical protein [Nocardioides alcanivorans]
MGDAPPTPGATVVVAPVVMPGLWDCHTHLTGLTGIESSQFAFTDLALRGARAVPDLRAALDAGVTSVRELGGLGIVLAKAVEEGVIEGPAIYAAGAWLSPTGDTRTCTRCRSSGCTSSLLAQASCVRAMAQLTSQQRRASNCDATPR